jgi:hypothetical protein
MNQASLLQARYNTLHAPATQNVRNPFPVWKLVLATLPTMPHPDNLIDVTVTRKVKVTGLGKAFAGMTTTEKQTGKVLAKQIIPAKTWDKKGKTIDQIIEELTDAGYFVNRASVTASLTQLSNSYMKTAKVASCWKSKPEANAYNNKKKKVYFRCS